MKLKINICLRGGKNEKCLRTLIREKTALGTNGGPVLSIISFAVGLKRYQSVLLTLTHHV